MSGYTMAHRLLGLLLCALLLAGVLPCFGALGASKKNDTGSLRVSLNTDISELPEGARIEFTLFKVGTPARGTDLGWKFDDGLSDQTSGIIEIIEAKRNSELQAAVDKLAADITGSDALRKKCRVTALDLSKGNAQTPKLEEGVYLGVLTRAPVGLTANASLFTIPAWNADKTDLQYDAKIVVKDVYERVEHAFVTVTKVDGTDGSPLTGARFTLYNGDKAIATYGGDSESRFTIRTDDPALADVLPSTDDEEVVLTLRETTAPTGYILPRNEAYKVVITRKTTVPDDIRQGTTTAYSITIGDGEKALSVPNQPDYEFENYHHSVTVYKVSNTGSPLSGAVFTLYYDGRAITTYSGERFTIATSDTALQRYLPSPGQRITLKLRETTAPDGYQRSDAEYDVVLSADSGTRWNDDRTKMINYVNYYITIDGGKDTLRVENQPTPTGGGGGGGGGDVPQVPPTPLTDITVTKVWVDDGNFNRVRPGAIDITLLADGSPVSAQPTWTKSGDTWTCTFKNLPRVDDSGKEITYTVDESPVEYYKKQVSGLTITNTLEDIPPKEYVDLSVTKIWQDNGNVEGRRPTNITIHLYRDGELIETVHVTMGTDWQYTFKHLPADNGYGHVYTYTIDEDTVPGYYKRVSGMNITNGLLPPGGDIPNLPEQPGEIPERGGTPAPAFEELSDEELEELFDMFGYGTPLYGMLGTGDQVPVWVWICGGVGIAALAMAILMGRKKRRQP